jgi:hypothetical protein
MTQPTKKTFPIGGGVLFGFNCLSLSSSLLNIKYKNKKLLALKQQISKSFSLISRAPQKANKISKEK